MRKTLYRWWIGEGLKPWRASAWRGVKDVVHMVGAAAAYAVIVIGLVALVAVVHEWWPSSSAHQWWTSVAAAPSSGEYLGVAVEFARDPKTGSIQVQATLKNDSAPAVAR